MIALHPAVQRLADKGYEGATLDEMAIVNTMRQALAQSFNSFQQIKVWLQQENPLGLRGAELSEWANDVAAWVLPEQMRIVYAPKARKQQEDGKLEHQEGNRSGQTSEASSGDSAQQSRQVEQGQGEMTWQDILPRMAAWQKHQFPAATTRSALEHIKKEIKNELEVTPDDAEEWADLFHLVVQGGVKASGSLIDFRHVIEKKLDHNMNERTWPAQPDSDNVYEHIKPQESLEEDIWEDTPMLSRKIIRNPGA